VPEQETASGNCKPVIKQSGKRMRAVERTIEYNGTISPGTKDSAGLITLIAKTVGSVRRLISIKERPNPCLMRIFFPAKLPRPTYMSHNERVIPISSSFPENIESNWRRTVICSSIEEKPIKTKVRFILNYIPLFSFLQSGWVTNKRIGKRT